MSRGRTLAALLFAFFVFTAESCGTNQSDRLQGELQEKLVLEATAQVGMPAIKNFREKKILKDIIEMRDQAGLVTYTYLWSDMQGKLVFFCDSVGYGLPYATQYTNPQKPLSGGSQASIIAQAEPNGLFSPSAAEGTWVLCKDPHGKDVRPVYVEPRIVTSPFRLAS